ncbi:unnamed protein product [Rhizoctonia solani]|uniref:Zn(2)-C6 fungal-type domain-containing protein n=1 Tax=Rhizoctonia solani TaxID=456999 RepID=A0A8H3H9C2_9AGAM|nr:unnamed protein product [Rhizoctonia solani]
MHRSTKASPPKSKSRPGPKGTSCLTCKRRHKRCDQHLPICQRCEKGGIECLGYDHNLGRRILVRATQPPAQPQRPIVPKPAAEHDAPQPSSSRLEPVGLNEAAEGCGGAASGSGSHLQKRQDTSVLRVTRPNEHTGGPLSTFATLFNLYTQLPCSPTDPLKSLASSPSFDDYILAQHRRIMEGWYFKPANGHQERVQKVVKLRSQGPLANISRWVAFIGVTLGEAFLRGDVSKMQVHNLWIEQIEDTLKRELSQEKTLLETQKRRRDWVCILLLKTMIIPSPNIYQALRSITPAFLQLVFSSPTLWPRDGNPTCVPLSSILCSEAHELAYFAFIDCACAMALGLPQQLEYDTTVYPWSSQTSSHQWGHGSPAEFQLILADINACRDKSPNARDWKEVERWLLAWQSQAGVYSFTEPWMILAWYAVQESWRFALLAYLYLAVCDAPSDDSQVQSCVKQMLQVIGTIKKRSSPSGAISFLVQYLIVSGCHFKLEVWFALLKGA